MPKFLQKAIIVMVTFINIQGMDISYEEMLLQKKILPALKESFVNAAIINNKQPNPDELEKAVNKIYPHIKTLNNMYKVQFVEKIKKNPYFLFDGQYGDTLCQLRAILPFLEKDKQMEEFFELTDYFGPAFALATAKKLKRSSIFDFPTQNLEPLSDCLKNLEVPKKQISGPQNVAAALRAVYLAEMYKAIFGKIEGNDKIKNILSITPVYSYPALEFFASYELVLKIIEERKIPVSVLYFDLEVEKNILNDVKIYNPFRSHESTGKSIIFEIYSSMREDKDRLIDYLVNPEGFKKAVLAIAAVHSQYPSSKDDKKNLSPEAQKYRNLAEKEGFGNFPLFAFNRSTASFTIETRGIPLNTLHVYTGDDEELKIKFQQLSKEIGNPVKMIEEK